MVSSAARLLEIELPNEGLIAHARLLDNLAPCTCAAVWELAAFAPELLAVHAAFTGRELSVRIPLELASRLDQPDVPPEHQTLFPIPGDLVWVHLPPYAWPGLAEPRY